MAMAVEGKAKKVSKKILEAEKRAKDRLAEEKKVREERRAFFKTQEAKCVKIEEGRQKWLRKLEADLTDDTLALWCAFGHEGSMCKFKHGECKRYHGGCKWNKEGYVCVAHLRGMCSMQHCDGQENLMYKHSEFKHYDGGGAADDGVAAVVQDEFVFKAEDFASLSL